MDVWRCLFIATLNSLFKARLERRLILTAYDWSVTATTHSGKPYMRLASWAEIIHAWVIHSSSLPALTYSTNRRQETWHITHEGCCQTAATNFEGVTNFISRFVEVRLLPHSSSLLTAAPHLKNKTDSPVLYLQMHTGTWHQHWQGFWYQTLHLASVL